MLISLSLRWQRLKQSYWRFSLFQCHSFIPTIVKSDAKLVVACILQRVAFSSLHWEGEGLIKQIRQLLQDVHDISIVWIPRNINIVAHELCKWAAAHNFVGFVDCSLVNCKIKDLLVSESFV